MKGGNRRLRPDLSSDCFERERRNFSALCDREIYRQSGIVGASRREARPCGLIPVNCAWKEQIRERKPDMMYFWLTDFAANLCKGNMNMLTDRGRAGATSSTAC